MEFYEMPSALSPDDRVFTLLAADWDACRATSAPSIVSSGFAAWLVPTLGRHTVTRVLAALGLVEVDWTAFYRLFGGAAGRRRPGPHPAAPDPVSGPGRDAVSGDGGRHHHPPPAAKPIARHPPAAPHWTAGCSTAGSRALSASSICVWAAAAPRPPGTAGRCRRAGRRRPRPRPSRRRGIRRALNGRRDWRPSRGCGANSSTLGRAARAAGGGC